MEYFFSDEQKMIKDLAAQIADEKIRPLASKYDEDGIFPYDIVKILADSDLTGYTYRRIRRLWRWNF